MEMSEARKGVPSRRWALLDFPHEANASLPVELAPSLSYPTDASLAGGPIEQIHRAAEVDLGE
jgi:hypothetical protein